MTIRSASGAYPVVFGACREAFAAAHGPYAVVTDANVHREWGACVPLGAAMYVAEPGEASKSLRVYQAILEWLADQGATRSTTLVAFGGGVVGDLAGFVAATYMRGIRLVQVPTTLLAMVDSSVGGKVGVDLPQGKNLAGAFYPPVRVVIATETLETLPERELANGAAEALKYGFILDGSLLDMIGDEPLRPGHPMLEPVIRRCISLKARVVEEDEHETTGRRSILNFGHTVGHALETVSGYGRMPHGEAVAIGMAVESSLGERLGVTPRGTAALVRGRLRSQRLPVDLPSGLDPAQLAAVMRHDKKATEAGLAFALLTGVGACKLVNGVGESELLAVLGDS
jgi:3-dehydroquinate synthase